MMRQQIRRPRWPLVACLLLQIATAAAFENKTGPNESSNSPRVFSPRMDYDEWTPLGRGDPLKNDPTFDYVPPILDRVQYWMDSQTTESSPKSDILVLGVTAKKTSPKIPEHFLKFVNGPKFPRNPDVQAPSYSADFTGSRGAEPPKLLRKTTFRNGLEDYRNPEHPEAIAASYYPSSYYVDKSRPETMMLPPPVARNPATNRPNRYENSATKNRLYPPEKHRFGTQTEAGPILHYKHHHQLYESPQNSANSYSLHDPHQSAKPPRKHQISGVSDSQKIKETQEISHIETIKSYTPISDTRHESTTSTVSAEKSNLIYQSSQTISGGWLAKTRPPTISPLVDLDVVTWRTPGVSYNRDRHQHDEDVHQAAGSSHHEVVLGPNANIIVEGDTGDREEIVMGQKEANPPVEPSSFAQEDENDQEEEIHEDDPRIPTAPEKNEENMYIVLANSSPGLEAEKTREKTAVTVVMPEDFKKNATEAFDEDETSFEDENASGMTSTPSRIETTRPEFETTTFRNSPGHPEIMDVFATETPIRDAENNQATPIRDAGNNQATPMRDAGNFQATPMRDAGNFQATPMRDAGNFQATPTRNAPQFVDDFGLFNRQASHARPAQVVTNRGPNHGTIMGMNFRDSSPPRSPPHSGIPAGHARPNMKPYRMPPFRTMTNSQPAMIVNHQNQPQPPPPRFYHNPAAMQPQTTATSNGVPQSMTPITSMPINGIRELLLRDEEFNQRNSHRRPEIVEKPEMATSSSSMMPGEGFAGFSGTKNANKEVVRFEEDLGDSRKKIEATTEAEEVKTTQATQTTTVETPTTTTAVTLTTDPIFSHYKQPANPLRGPMYLIIQGHSKVKTYKPFVDKHGNQVERSERLENTTRMVSDFEKFVEENTRKIAVESKRIEEAKTTTEKPKEQPVGKESLLSLVDSGLGGFPEFSESPAAAMDN